jgi:hypothetical protein
MKKNIVTVEINLHDVEEANLYLRSLWSKIRREFGGCSWIYTPSVNKKARTVTLGDFTTPNLQIPQIHVSLTYEKRGGIKKMIFVADEKEDISFLFEIANALKNDYCHDLQSVAIKSIFQSNFPISSYEGDNLLIRPLTNGQTEIILKVSSFDETDQTFVVKKKYNVVLDVLASNIWYPMLYKEDGLGVEYVKSATHNLFFESIQQGGNNENLEKGGFLFLPKKAFELVLQIANDTPLSKAQEQFVSACRLYHSALKLDHSRNVFILKDIDYYEIMMTKYMSTLEVLSVRNDLMSKCQTCGQDIYSISSQVKGYLSRVFKNEDQVRRIHSFYSDRSKFLHTGKFQSTRSYMGISIPQLSKSEAVIEQQSIYDSGILKYSIGQCLHFFQNLL